MIRFVIIRSIDDLRLAARIAADLGQQLDIVSAPDAGIQAGALWWRALAAAAPPGVIATALIDCGDSPGRSLGAIRAGARDVLFAGAETYVPALGQIAETAGARLWRQRPEALDLVAAGRPDDACRAWLQSGALPGSHAAMGPPRN